MTTETKPTVMLIDFSNLWWQAWHSNGDAISMARQRVRGAVDRAANTIPGALVAVCLDEGRSFRKEMLPEYKANRPEKDQAVLAEMDRCKQALRDAGYLLWGADTFEADDVIATAAHKAVEAGHPFCIASADKDLLQLLDLEGSSALRTHQWVIVQAADVEARFGVKPGFLGDYLALVGDTSDNIRGCEGVGPKRAAQLLHDHISLGNLYAKIDGLQTGQGTGGVPWIESKTPAARAISTPAVVENLWKCRGDVERARKLVELRTDAPINFLELYQSRTSKGATMAEEEKRVDNLIVTAPPPAAPEAPPPEVPATVEPPPAAVVLPAGSPAPSTPVTRALVPVEYERQLEPTNSDAAIKMGALLFDSRLYSRFGTAAAVTAVIIRGREMGLGALQSLDAFHVIEGKPCPHAHLIVSLAEARPECEYFMLIESTNERATYETKHRKQPKPVRHTYTIEDAVDAGLCGLEIVPRTAKPGEKDARGNWDKRRAEMLRKTCAVQLARIVYPAAALGLYSIEEMAADAEVAA